jgi:hypothetical protein
MDAMEKDFQATGKCGLTLAKEKEPAPPWSWALAKKSPFTEYINRGYTLIHSDTNNSIIFSCLLIRFYSK